MANTYLTHSASGGSRTTWTISAWVKRSKLTSGTATIFNGYVDGSNESQLLFNSDYIEFYDWSSNSRTGTLFTNRKFRDTSAWYHIVAVWDTTNSTAGNRMRLYVNGVEETSFSTDTQPSPSQNSSLGNGSYAQQIGLYASNAGFYFDGLMSYVAFVDGTAELPTIFGETDSVTGQWKIKTDITPSVAWGTNGFLILKNGNSLTDESTNTNNFTLGAGTLTNTLDCPDNVFATLNPLSGSLSNNTLSNGNNTITVTSGWRWRPSTIAPSSGKYYAEFKPTSGGSIYTVAGVTPQVSWKDIDGEVIGSGANSENKSVGYQQDGQVKKGNSTQYTGSSYTTNDIIGVALDLDNHKVYFSKNGTYQNSGDPTSGATGTGAVALDSTLSDWSISISVAGSTTSANYGNGYFGTTAVSSAGTPGSTPGTFEYDVPSGYQPLTTKGLNA